MFLAMLFKRDKGEFSLLIVLVAGILIFFYALAQIQVIVDFLHAVMSRLPIDEVYLLPLLKMLGITYIAAYGASLCREAGYGSIANQMEMFAKLAIIVLSIPELYYLMEVLDEMLA